MWTTMADSCMVNWLVLKTRAFGLYSWIVIGQTRQLILSANHNLLAQTKSPRLQSKPVYHAVLSPSEETILYSSTCADSARRNIMSVCTSMCVQCSMK